MILDPLFYLVAIPAVLIVGISKGGFGGGLGLLAVPLMSLAVPPVQAAAILLPILCVMDLFSVWGFRGRFDKDNLKVLIPAALLGLVLGTLTFRLLSEAHIKLAIGLMAVAFCGQFVASKVRRRQPEPRGRSLFGGGLWGTLTGFCSFSVHAGGPPLSIYLLPQRLDKSVFVGTTVLLFALVNYVKLLPYAWLGLLQPGNLLTSLWLVALAPVGVWLGIYLHHRISDGWFYLCCYGLLAMTGLKLCYEGAAVLFGTV
ncbi:MAG: sulfite exporter TauE/SafE family protein [Motiliproteus sp.]